MSIGFKKENEDERWTLEHTKEALFRCRCCRFRALSFSWGWEVALRAVRSMQPSGWLEKYMSDPALVGVCEEKMATQTLRRQA